MTRTTPPRPFDVEALFPELAALRRAATRLHPRRGVPTAADSSVGGPMLWPAGEPWPVCTVPHHPLLGVAQLYRRDVPGLPFPEEGDLLQVFWCGYERHGESGHEPHVELRWRHAADVAEPLAEQPVPFRVGRTELVPHPCVLHPEVVTEYPWFEELDLGLQERIELWDTPEGYDEDAEDAEDASEPGETYLSDLSTAPGWKTGGHIAWNLTGPTHLRCTACAADLLPLLTAADREWDSSTASWVPYEDRPVADPRRAYGPTGVSPGRGRLIIAACPRDPRHPHRLISQ